MILEQWCEKAIFDLGVYTSAKLFCNMVSKRKPFSLTTCYSLIDEEFLSCVKIGSRIIIKSSELYFVLSNTASNLNFKEDWKKNAPLALGTNATPRAIAEYLGVSVDLIQKKISKNQLFPLQEKNPKHGPMIRTVVKVASVIDIMVCPYEAALIKREKDRIKK